MKPKPKPKKRHANAGNKHAQRGPARRVPVFVRVPPATLATLKHEAATRGLSQSDTVIHALDILKSSPMTSIHITDAQAEILDGADQSKSDPIARQLRTECQAQANATGKTCEIYHPEGYVWDARSPN